MRSLFLHWLTAGLLAIGLCPSVVAQRRAAWCATDQHTAALQATFHDPALEAQRAAAEDLSARMQADDALARTLRPNALKIVPMVIHVVTPCGATSISKQQILNGFRVMKQDWLRTNPDTAATRGVFQPYASSLDIEFRLAQLDPQGNPTDGINRVTSVAQSTADGFDPVKVEVPAWPNYFNIWLVPSIDGGAGGGTILGYGQFPGTGPWDTWGFVMRADCWTGAWGPNDRTASHEVGHCFNLYHTFQGSCGSSCTGSGDRVCDTPPMATATQGCDFGQNSCSNDGGTGSPFTTNVVDPIENYMSYDDCQNMFTVGQKVRVDAAMQSIAYLQNLASPANQLATGIADGQVIGTPAPIAYMATCQLNLTGAPYLVCQGRPVDFIDASFGTTIVSRQWTFTNATPATSSLANPTVVFNAPGLQTVTLVAIGAGGVSSAPLTLQVQVLPGGQLVAPFQESFEGAGVDTVFRITSTSTVTGVRRWSLVTPATVPGLVASDGQTAFQLQNGNIPTGTVTTLTSPSFDTRGLAPNSQARLKFDLAYSRRNGASADELSIFFSTDCGRSWVRKYRKTSAALSTTGTQMLQNFTPTSAGQWRTDSITIANQYLNQPGVLIKFEGTSQGSGNNLYLDNLRISAPLLGVSAELAAAGVTLTPNPLTNETALRLSLSQPTRVAVRVSDVLGRVVLTDGEQRLGAGEHELLLGQRLGFVRAGIYVVTATLDGQPYTQKLLVR